MDFEFTTEQLEFTKEVEEFLDAHDDPEIFDLTRENMAQIVDTPKRRRFMAEVGERGWLGITWPKEYGGKAGEGIYEYLLNEALAARGGPQIGKGVGIIGKTIISHGSEKLKAEFLPKILRNEVEFAVGYSEPNAGSDAASMQLKATRDGDGWRLNGQKTWTTSAHFADWYWVGARTDPEAPKHHGITLFLVPMDHPGITVKPIWTMGDERTNEVYLDEVWVSDDYVVGDVNQGFQYISEALDLERFTLFTYSPVAQRLDLLTDYVRTATRDGQPLKDDAVVRAEIARLHTEAEVARVLGLKFVFASSQGGAPPTAEASEYKLFTTEYSRRLADSSMDIAGPGGQLPRAGRGRADGRPARVHLPLHRHRHHRWWCLRDPEEHHRPAQARAPEELLTVRCRCPTTLTQSVPLMPPAPSARHHHPRPGHRGPGGARPRGSSPTTEPRWSRWGRSPAGGPSPSCRPSSPMAAGGGYRRVCIDLKDDDGRDAFLALVAGADVVVESFRPGVLDRLGLSFDRLTKVNGRIVLCSTTGFGQDGPGAGMGRP